MEMFHRIVNNTLISLIGQVITWASTLLLTIAYGRFLGVVKFGELYFALTFVQLVGFPVEFGLNQQIIRDVAPEPQKAARYFMNTLLIKSILWIILFALLLLICLLLGYNPEQRMLISLCGITLLLRSLVNIVSVLHYADEHTVIPVVGNILEKCVSAVVSILLLLHGAGVIIMAYVLMGSMGISGLWQLYWFRRFHGFELGIDRALIGAMVSTSIPFLAYGVLGIIYYRIDTVLLSLMTNVTVVGLYGAAYRLFDTMTFLPSLVISAIMYPVFSKLTVTSEKNLKVAIEKSLNFLLFFSLPISVGLMVAAPEIIGFLYHRGEFDGAISALIGLAPGLVFLYANSVFNAVLISTKHEKRITLMAAIALVFNLGLNLALIPLFQQIGAAIITSLTELLLCGLSLLFLPRHLLPLGSLPVIGKSLLASLVMALVIVNLNVYSLSNIFLILPVAMLSYFGTAALLGTIPRTDMQTLYLSLRNRSTVA